MNEKIVLLDFCDTVAKFQTFDPFVLFVLKKTKPTKYKIVSNKLFKFTCINIQKFLRFFGYKEYLFKTIIVRQLKNIQYETLSILAYDYYQQMVKPNLINETLKKIIDLKKQGSKILIISGGCDLYIKYFADEFGIKDIIATKLAFDKNSLCLGYIKGLDCMGYNKEIMLMDYLKKNRLNENNLIACITDSKSDLPILRLCQNKIIVSKNRHQNWVTSDMEEIIWE